MKKCTALFLILLLLLPTITLSENVELPLAPNGATISFTLQENYYAGTSYADNLMVYQELEKRTGVKVEWDVIELNAFNETMEIRLASGSKLSDVIQLPNYNAADVMRYAEAGLILPLDDLIKEHAPNIYNLFFVEVPELGRTMTGYDGHIYAIPQNFYGMNFVAPYCLTIRQDWLDDLNLPTPTTADEWYTVLKAFKEQDPNGNGIADEVPMSTQGKVDSWENAYGYLATAFGLTGPVNVRYYPDENGIIVDQYRTPEFKEWLTFINKLYMEGLIDAAFSVESTKLPAMASQNILGSTAMYADSTTTYQKNARAAGDSDAYYKVLPTPVDKDGNPGRQIGRTLTGFRYSLSKDCEDPVLAIKWIDYQYANPEGRDLMHYGIEGYHWNWNEDKTKRVWTDLVANNPEGLAMYNVLRRDGAYATQFTNRTKEFFAMMVEDYVLNDVQAILPTIVAAYPAVIATAEESQRLASLVADLNTYTNEMVQKIIMGQVPLTEYDEFVATMESMGADEVLTIKQAQYDRYIGK
jgi:putative aldouronate transport system substrate-binding protein